MVRGNVIFSEKATNDLMFIVAWYNEERADLGYEFMAEIDKILIRIQTRPLIFTFIKKNIRRYKFKRFPYYMYFSHADGITILRLRHIKQQPLKRFT